MRFDLTRLALPRIASPRPDTACLASHRLASPHLVSPPRLVQPHLPLSRPMSARRAESLAAKAKPVRERNTCRAHILGGLCSQRTTALLSSLEPVSCILQYDARITSMRRFNRDRLRSKCFPSCSGDRLSEPCSDPTSLRTSLTVTPLLSEPTIPSFYICFILVRLITLPFDYPN